MFFPVIMAGGSGERFWPQSRQDAPKQLQVLTGARTMVEETVARLAPLAPESRMLILTNARYGGRIAALLPQLPAENIVCEPARRDTAPCVALAAGIIRARGGEDAVMALLPSDAAIGGEEAFRRVLGDCARYAGEHPDALLTIGVRPTWAATCYGYIHCGYEIPFEGETRFRAVRSFREKPNESLASEFLESGEFCWNSGIFIWSVRAIRAAFAAYAPELAQAEEDFYQAEKQGKLASMLAERFAACPKISIDYAIMEHASPLVMAESDFEWDDVGNWTAMRSYWPRDAAGNAVSGRFTGLDCRNCIIRSDGKHLIAGIDLDDMIVVQTGDVTLIAPARSNQKIKQLLKDVGRLPDAADLL